MTGRHQTVHTQTRWDAIAGVQRCAAFVATAHVGVVAMLARMTAKINPSWASGGLPREGNP